MSHYSTEPLPFQGLRTIPLRERGGKVQIRHFARPYEPGTGIGGLLDSLPAILAAPDFEAVLSAIRTAREQQRAILWGLGGHVIKCGLAPVFTDLMNRGFATGFVFNGAASIHDFEIALAGATSEDVESVLPDGRFGTAEETGREMNGAIRAGAKQSIGLGESLGAKLQEIADPACAPYSLQWQAYRRRTPVTVHVAVGTDTPHTHPAVDPAALGQTTHHDFRLLCSLVAQLHDGGIYLNVGSAVVLPEVFLKAVSVVRNLGHSLERFTTVNFDFLQHYRPRQNVVHRPHAGAGGAGYAITGHHELMIPLLAAALVESDE